jgi:hypothetical protein
LQRKALPRGTPGSAVAQAANRASSKTTAQAALARGAKFIFPIMSLAIPR